MNTESTDPVKQLRDRMKARQKEQLQLVQEASKAHAIAKDLRERADTAETVFERLVDKCVNSGVDAAELTEVFDVPIRSAASRRTSRKPRQATTSPATPAGLDVSPPWHGDSAHA